MNDLCEIHAVWVGKELGKIGRCCLASFVKHGHSVYLHTYQEVIDLPEGVIRLDANLIMPFEQVESLRHRITGSYALFSDVFRYQLLQKIPNIVYVDTDVYCLKPIIVPEHGYLMGFEDDYYINGAVLAMPQDSPLLNALLEITNNPYFIPEWYTADEQKRLKWRKFFRRPTHLADMPWGIIGPAAITHYVRKLDLLKYVQGTDVFYPVIYTRTNHLLEPDLTISDLTTQRTICVHLYHEGLRQRNWQDAHESCVLAKMYRLEI